MNTVIIVVVGLILAGAYMLVVMNRASYTVVGAALPAAMALLSALILVFAFNPPPPISRTFPVVFVVEKESLLPVTIPDRPFPFQSLGLPDMARQANPKILDVPKGQDAFEVVIPLYHEFLQKMLVDDLALGQFATWRTKTERFVGLTRSMPMPDASGYHSKVLSAQEMKNLFGKNRFANVHSGVGNWALPSGTDLRIEAPKVDPKLRDVGVIRLINSLCQIAIRTEMSYAGVGLGQYTPIVGASAVEAQAKYWTLQYIAKIEVSFNRYRVGNPNMTAYREWASAIVEELALSFDEDSIWARTKDSFILRSHLPAGTPQMPMGPVRVNQASAESKEHSRDK